jgi:hypothetical protein
VKIEPIYIVGPFGVFFSRSGANRYRSPADSVSERFMGAARLSVLCRRHCVQNGFRVAGPARERVARGRAPDQAGGLFVQGAADGQSAGILAARPWVCEITEWIRGGRNDLEIEVVGSSANLTAEIGPSGAGLLDTGLIGGVELLTY